LRDIFFALIAIRYNQTMEHPPPLDEAHSASEPFPLFRQWFDAAVAAQAAQPEAMALATVAPDGAPSVRMVLLRGFDARGFVFYTNYQSRKAQELMANPHAALVLYWPLLERQVRIEGTVEIISAEESDAYFRTRPRGSQLSAWASPQSRPVPDRNCLEEQFREMEEQFAGEVPRPPFWGGYRVVPQRIEFWQGGDNRLHDRLLYRQTDSGWIRERLAP
jgi:pyridoxamine 5'-phosphate oxidase